MTIRLSPLAGFCPGVKRADEEVRRLIAERKEGEVLLTLGSLIHNRLYNEELADLGVRAVGMDEVSALLDAKHDARVTLVVRTHGITKEEYCLLDGLKKDHPNFTYVDMTCPFVSRIHKIVDENTDPETALFLFCDKSHPEARGIISFAHGPVFPFSSEDDLKNVSFTGDRVLLCSQTTENSKYFEYFKNFFKKLYTNPKIFDTICNVTEKRQNEAKCLARECDTMIVIGGKDSSNTAKLYDLCREVCPRTRWIESAASLDADFLNSAKCAGITAGASTPDGIITEVFRKMETMENFGELFEQSLTTLHTGETVTGIVFAVTPGEIHLDLGAKYTGVIVKEQISDDSSVDLVKTFKVGDEVSAFVIRVDDGKGVATLSKKRVDADKSLGLFKEALDNGTVLEGNVTAAVKGGVTMNVNNNRVFIPASQTGIAKDGDLSVLVGTKQKIRIIDFDEAKKKAVGSIKVVANEEKRAKEDAMFATLEVGQHFKGTVKNLTPYGAFVDIGGVDGMVHNTELSWKRIKHPSQVVSVGQEIEVFIKDLDVEKKRISLGYKTQEMDSWFQFTQKFQVGDVVPAKIVSIMPFGAFAEVYPDVDGLIHISRISSQRINSPADVLSVGQVVDVKITEIDDENRKLALSIRALTEAAERAAAEEARAAERAAREAEKAERDAERAAERAKEEAERAEMAPYIVGSID